jgi:hypothetical protein
LSLLLLGKRHLTGPIFSGQHIEKIDGADIVCLSRPAAMKVLQDEGSVNRSKAAGYEKTPLS